jgi:hypothetical protein
MLTIYTNLLYYNNPFPWCQELNPGLPRHGGCISREKGFVQPNTVKHISCGHFAIKKMSEMLANQAGILSSFIMCSNDGCWSSALSGVFYAYLL